MPLPDALDTPRFKAAWSEWIAYRRERKLTCTPRTLTKQLNEAADWGERDAIEAINTSITKGWQGFFKPKGNSYGRTNGFDPSEPITPI